MAKTATFIRELSGWSGDARLYRLSEPATTYGSEKYDHVAVSAISAAFDTGRAETYIFPALSNGDVVSWSELPGSFRGAKDHERALRGAGYEVRSGVEAMEDHKP